MSFERVLILIWLSTVLFCAGCASTQGGAVPLTSAVASAPAAESSTRASTPSTGVRATIDPPAWRSDVIAMISVDVAGGPADGRSWNCTISEDGRFVAFDSQAADLVPDDDVLVSVPTGDPHEPSTTHNASDVFVFDRQTGVTDMVSVASDGTHGNNDSDVPFLSASGRWVVFQSKADNLVPNDTNGFMDVFLRDREKGTTERISVGMNGSEADGGSNPRGLSKDGRYVVFASDADNLVPEDTNGSTDVFVRDRVLGTTERASVGADGEQGDGRSGDCRISADGRYVVFQSAAADLVAGDTNQVDDILVRDRQKGVTERVSVNRAGVGGNHMSFSPSISADGRYVAFASAATNLVPGDTSSLRNDVFVYDREKKTIERISVSPSGKEGNNASGGPSLSADGRYVAFRSYAGNLVAGDTNRKLDVFVRDLQTHVTRRVSLGVDGRQADAESMALALSGDGRWVAFTSLAGNLVPGDTNEMDDVFVAKADR